MKLSGLGWLLTGTLVYSVSGYAAELAEINDMRADSGGNNNTLHETDTTQITKCAHYDSNRQAFFGDLHIHTGLSLDANMQGTRTRPADAYRFARGQSLDIPPYDRDGRALKQARAGRPLDFAAVTDHAEMLGETRICRSPVERGFDSLLCRAYRFWPDKVGLIFSHRAANAERFGFCGDDGHICTDAAAIPWREIQDAAAAAQDNSPACEFTTFVGYEWTGASFVESGLVANLHRNVIFRSATVPELPISFIEASSAEALWTMLDAQCSKLGESCEATVIPHNSNLSLGQMFPTDIPASAVDPASYLRKRNTYERLVEVIQHKGSSECYFGPGMLAEDELCQFEQLPWNSFSGNRLTLLAETPRPGDGFLREALREGLRQQRSKGINPYKLGFIGSTDSHRSLAGGVDEAGFQGHGGAGNAAPAGKPRGLPDQWEFNPGGLAVLYAEENSRDSLFEAMQRREAYATSGPRIGLRFFAGEKLSPGLCDAADFVTQAYRQAVPMGGDLVLSADEKPRFLVAAMKDPGFGHWSGTDLQRIQIIKGWIDQRGQSHERIVDIAGDPPGVASVNPDTCDRQGRGHQQLCSVWEDKDFNPLLPAYYYARVLENPSCRWSTYVCNAQGVNCNDPNNVSAENRICCDAKLPKTIQERAWSSPVWYNPL